MGNLKYTGFIKKFLKPYRHWLVIVAAAALLGTAVDIAIVYFIQDLISTSLIGDSGYVINIILCISGIIILGMSVKFIVKKITILFGVYIVRDIQQSAYRHISVIPISCLERFHSGDIVSRFTNDIFVIQNFLQNDFYYLIYYPLLIISTFTYMLIINWKLVLFSSVLTPLIIFLIGLLSAPITKYTKGIQGNLSEANSLVRDSVAGASTIKAYNLEAVLSEKYKDIMKEWLKKSLSLEKLRSVLAPSNVILRLLPFVLCLLYGGFLVVQGSLDIASFIAFFPLLNYMLQPTSMIPYYINSIRTVTAVTEHIFEIFEQPFERQDGGSFLLDDKSVMLEFDSVSFQYGNQGNILENLNFRLERGKTTAIVGLSGSGKSTILKLACGFYEPGKGSIKLGGAAYSEWNLKKARENIAIVSQDNYLFPASIADNISCGKPEITREDIMEAAKAADAHDFITALPNGYDTAVGEMGAGVSGGQRQRIAIARAFLKNAPILLFDEPTSALDTQSEASVHDAIEKLKGKYSVLIVTHRLSTAKMADEIIVLDGGHIVQKGSHDQLMEEDGIYKVLYSRQLDSGQ